MSSSALRQGSLGVGGRGLIGVFRFDELRRTAYTVDLERSRRLQIAANVERDSRQTELLRDHGWRVVRVWEHELKGVQLGETVRRIGTLVRPVLVDADPRRAPSIDEDGGGTHAEPPDESPENHQGQRGAPTRPGRT